MSVSVTRIAGATRTRRGYGYHREENDIEQQLRSWLIEEFDDLSEPPIGDLVDTAVREGDRLRVRRRIWAGGAALAGVLALATGLFLALPSRPTAPPAGPGPLVPATPRGVLALLLATLPDDQTAEHATDANGSLHASVWVVRPDVTGMVRVAVSTYHGTPDTTPGSHAGDVYGAPSPYGGGIVMRIGSNATDCTRATSIWSYHPNGTLVEVDVATCMVGQGNVKTVGKPVLNTAEAVMMANDPRWGVRIGASYNESGARLTDVATFR